jgi:uncharacterized membrane protein
MAFCTGCGKEVPAGAMACPACGQAAAGAAPVSSSSTSGSTGGMTDNVAAMLAYIPIVGLIFLLIEPYNKNKFLRFHCFQSLFYLLACIVVSIVLGFIPLLGIIVGMLLGLGEFVLWLVLLLKAYQGQKFKLPFIGDLAEQQANAG